MEVIMAERFEIPQELRQLAEENVERARKLYLQFMDGVAQTMAVWSASPSDAVAPGFDEIRQRAIKLARENADAAFALASKVAQAKDLQELLSLQTRYVQSQMRWYADQTQEFGELMIRSLAKMKEPHTADMRPAAPQAQNSEPPRSRSPQSDA
jgi:phasin